MGCITPNQLDRSNKTTKEPARTKNNEYSSLAKIQRQPSIESKLYDNLATNKIETKEQVLPPLQPYNDIPPKIERQSTNKRQLAKLYKVDLSDGASRVPNINSYQYDTLLTHNPIINQKEMSSKEISFKL